MPDPGTPELHGQIMPRGVEARCSSYSEDQCCGCSQRCVLRSGHGGPHAYMAIWQESERPSREPVLSIMLQEGIETLPKR